MTGTPQGAATGPEYEAALACIKRLREGWRDNYDEHKEWWHETIHRPTGYGAVEPMTEQEAEVMGRV